MTSNPIIPGGETYEEIKDNAEKEKIEVIEGAVNRVDSAIKSGYNNVVKSTTDAIDLLKTRKVDFARGVVVGIDENLGFSIGQGIYFECTERRIDGSETKTYLIGKITGEGIATIVGAAEVAHGIAETIYGSEEIINGAVHLNPSTIELGSSISATGAVRSIVAGKIVKDSIENISKDVNKLNASTGNKIESGLGVDKGSSKAVEWTNHGYKHVASKNADWKDVIKSTTDGPAKYKQGTNIEELERMIWNEGIPVTNGKNWKVQKFDEVVGASGGKETKYVRVEESGGTIHGHPITEQEFMKLTK